MTIENRLKEERLRLGFTQPEFAALGEKTKKTLIDYEKGATSPDAKFLAAIAAAGADVAYILTGQRLGMAAPPGEAAETVAALSPAEAALLDNFRACEQEDRDAIKKLALRSAEAQHKEVTDGKRGGKTRTRAA